VLARRLAVPQGVPDVGLRGRGLLHGEAAARALRPGALLHQRDRGTQRQPQGLGQEVARARRRAPGPDRDVVRTQLARPVLLRGPHPRVVGVRPRPPRGPRPLAQDAHQGPRRLGRGAGLQGRNGLHGRRVPQALGGPAHGPSPHAGRDEEGGGPRGGRLARARPHRGRAGPRCSRA
jgi:hypothetical protein